MTTDPFAKEKDEITESEDPIAAARVRGRSSWLSVLPGDGTDTRGTGSIRTKHVCSLLSHLCAVPLY